jgi:hypothetical protein
VGAAQVGALRVAARHGPRLAIGHSHRFCGEAVGSASAFFTDERRRSTRRIRLAASNLLGIARIEPDRCLRCNRRQPGIVGIHPRCRTSDC